MSRNKHVRAALAIAASLLLLLIAAAVPTTAGDGNGSTQMGNPRPKADGGGDIVTSPMYAPHQLVVKLRTDTVRFSADNGVVAEYSSHLSAGSVYLVNLEPGTDVMQAAADFNGSADVEYAHPNYLLNHSHPIQGSYPFSDQNFKGDIANQYASGQLGLTQAHQLAQGTGVTVAVIDGGIDFLHPGLGGAAVSGYDFVDGDDDAFDEAGGRASGHGTFVAGVIHLVAPSATIKSYRVMNASGDGDGFTVARAIERAVADGCSIINLSLALTARSLAVRDAIDMASASGVLVVGGAGNSGSDEPVYPAAEANILAVGALDSLAHKTDFSNYGYYVDLCAPGANVYSAYQKPYYAWWSGTSFSAPFVSGLAALVKQKYPASNAVQIRNRLMLTADNLDLLNPDYIGVLGAGIVDPPAALTNAVTHDTAVFIPDSLFYTYEQYSQLYAVPMVTGVLISTNAPAPYTPHVVDTGTFAFAWVDDTSGVTIDSVDIFLRTTNTVGTYYNILSFDVVGVENPAEVVVILNVVPQDTTGSAVWLIPQEMWFTGNINTRSVLYGASYLSSTNAPAAFHAEIPSGTDGFLTLIDSVGQTNDSVRFGVIPSRVPGPGLYADTIVYHVDGIEDPVALVVNLTALDSMTYAQASVSPAEFWFTGDIMSDTFFIGHTYLASTNAPARYNSLMLPSGGQFTSNLSPNGYTDDTVSFLVRPSRVFSPGFYTDTIAYFVNGVANPVLIVIHLSAVQNGSSLCDEPGDLNGDHVAYDLADVYLLDSALRTGHSWYITGKIGNADIAIDCRIDSADLAMMWAIVHGDSLPPAGCGSCADYQFMPSSHTYCSMPGDVNQNGIPWEMADLALLETALTTGDSTVLEPLIGNADITGDCIIDTVDRVMLEMVILGYDSAPGTPCDNCASHDFVPNAAPLCLLPTDVNCDGMRFTVMDIVALTVALDSNDISYLGPIVGNSDVNGDCRIDSLDRINYERYFLYGFDSTDIIFTCASCQEYVFGSDTVGNQGGDSAWFMPNYVGFYQPYGSTDIDYNHTILASTMATSYSATHTSSLNWLVFDTMGVTNDSVLIGANPTGLEPGIYVDTLVCLMSGIRYPVYLKAQLTITGADSVATGPSGEMTLANYPNPFNPTTECVFSLPASSHVTLKIYDITGREVTTLVDETRTAGTHRVVWDGRTSSGNQAASGVYLYRIEANSRSLTRKMLLLK